jgi:hypothetical protein
MKKARLLAGLAALFAGSMLASGCLNDFWSGLFHRGFINNKWADLVTDWLNEDLFS